MNVKQSHFTLTETIKQNSLESRDIHQVTKRMKKLLPDSLSSLKSVHRAGNSAARAERIAASDQEYLRMIDEYVDLYSKGLEARIQYETHKMLLSARQTMRFFYKSN